MDSRWGAPVIQWRTESRMQGCRNLQEIDASDNNLTDLSGLNSHASLKVLRLAGNNIQVVEGIERLKELCTLDLRRNHIAGDSCLFFVRY